MRYVTFFLRPIFEIRRVFYLYSPSQFGLARLQGLSSHVRLVAAQRDSVGLNDEC